MVASASLMNEGIRPINNVVDVTNYIPCSTLGQPMHMPLTWNTFEGTADIRIAWSARAEWKVVTL